MIPLLLFSCVLLLFFALPIIVCESLEWQSLPFSNSPNNPIPREYAALTRLVGTNEYYLIGGKDSSGNDYNDVYRSTDQFYSFTQVTNAAAFPATSTACAVSIRSEDNVPYLLLYGGIDNMNVWYSTDGGSLWIEGPEFGFLREYNMRSPMCTNTNKEKEMIVIGGWTDGYIYSNMMYRLSVFNNTSVGLTQSTLTPFSARASGAIASSGSFVFIAGGNSDSAFLNDVWFSSDNAYTWARMTEQSEWTARIGLAGWMIYGVMYIAAGFESSTPHYMNDVWKSIDGGVHWSLVSDSVPWAAVDSPLAVSDVNASTIYIGGGGIMLSPANQHFYSAIPSLPYCSPDQIWDYSTANRQFQCVSISDPSVYPSNPPHLPTSTPPSPSTTLTPSTSSSSSPSCSPSDWPDWVPVNPACRCASVWSWAGQTFCDRQCANPAESMPKPFCITEELCDGFMFVYCGPSTTTSPPVTSSTVPTTSPSSPSTDSQPALPSDFSARMGVLFPSLIIQLLCGGYGLLIYRRVLHYSKHDSQSQDPLIVKAFARLTVVRKKTKVIMLIAFIIAPIFIIIGYFQHYIRYSCLLFAAFNCIRVFLLYRYLKKHAPLSLFEQVNNQNVNSNQQSGMADRGARAQPSMVKNTENVNDDHTGTGYGYVPLLHRQTNSEADRYHLHQDEENV